MTDQLPPTSSNESGRLFVHSSKLFKLFILTGTCPSFGWTTFARNKTNELEIAARDRNSAGADVMLRNTKIGLECSAVKNADAAFTFGNLDAAELIFTARSRER